MSLQSYKTELSDPLLLLLSVMVQNYWNTYMPKEDLSSADWTFFYVLMVPKEDFRPPVSLFTGVKSVPGLCISYGGRRLGL